MRSAELRKAAAFQHVRVFSVSAFSPCHPEPRRRPRDLSDGAPAYKSSHPSTQPKRALKRRRFGNRRSLGRIRISDFPQFSVSPLSSRAAQTAEGSLRRSPRADIPTTSPRSQSRMLCLAPFASMRGGRRTGDRRSLLQHAEIAAIPHSAFQHVQHVSISACQHFSSLSISEHLHCVRMRGRPLHALRRGKFLPMSDHPPSSDLSSTGQNPDVFPFTDTDPSLTVSSPDLSAPAWYCLQTAPKQEEQSRHPDRARGRRAGLCAKDPLSPQPRRHPHLVDRSALPRLRLRPLFLLRSSPPDPRSHRRLLHCPLWRSPGRVERRAPVSPCGKRSARATPSKSAASPSPPPKCWSSRVRLKGCNCSSPASCRRGNASPCSWNFSGWNARSRSISTPPSR